MIYIDYFDRGHKLQQTCSDCYEARTIIKTIKRTGGILLGYTCDDQEDNQWLTENL